MLFRRSFSLRPYEFLMSSARDKIPAGRLQVK
jgi:hypothetical protein